jgi:hypothetical protein
MNINDIFIMQEALASCAIEGNPYAIRMMNLFKTNKEEFYSELYKLQERGNEIDERVPETHNKKKSTRKPR